MTLLVGWDASETGTAKGPADRERAHLRLVHAHLPMLEEAELVTYDPEHGTVRMESLAAETIDRLERNVADWDGNAA